MANKKKGNLVNKIIKGIVGGILIAFAIIPTPDDVTVVSPVVAFGFGSKLLSDAL